jgi:hypothetical protein
MLQALNRASSARLIPLARTAATGSAPTPAKPETKGDGLSLSKIRTGVVKTWDKVESAMPWVKEQRHVAQIDLTRKTGNASDFTRDARAAFGAIDRNTDGTLSTRELNTAMASPRFKEGQAAAVVAMKEGVDAIEDLSNDQRSLETKGITKKDLDQFDRLKDDSAIRSSGLSTYGQAVWRIRTANRDLYAKGDLSVRGQAIDQGNLGNCYFLAAVSGQAALDPASIRKMIKANQDGTFTVTFPDRKPVTIQAPTDAEIGAYSTGTDDGLWVKVLEKAYTQVRDRSRLIKRQDPYKAIEGGFHFQGIGAMTGSFPTYGAVPLMSEAKIVSFVKTGEQDRRLMTISTGKWPGRDVTKADGLPTGHVYTVMGYDAAKGTIRIRNPWGTGGDGQGYHDLTPAQVKKNFLAIAKQR